MLKFRSGTSGLNEWYIRTRTSTMVSILCYFRCNLTHYFVLNTGVRYDINILSGHPT